MGSLCLSAPAKVNLWLYVTGRRSDGYHLLHSLMHKVDLCDRVELEECASGITLSCPDSELPENEENIALRAALRLADHCRREKGRTFGVRIRLWKKIPLAAGLGGGSSDAAAVLKGLDRLFRLGVGADELHDLGLGLGADVPFFLQSHACCLATGIGERLVPAPPLADRVLVLVNPGFPVSTRWVYEKFSLTFSREKRNLRVFCPGQGDHPERPAEIRIPDDLHNDLAGVTEETFVEIRAIRRELLDGGASASLMSGSGPTVFGVFTDTEQAHECVRRLRSRYPLTWLVRPLSTGDESLVDSEHRSDWGVVKR